jgi:hypothetical protein
LTLLSVGGNSSYTSDFILHITQKVETDGEAVDLNPEQAGIRQLNHFDAVTRTPTRVINSPDIGCFGYEFQSFFQICQRTWTGTAVRNNV